MKVTIEQPIKESALNIVNAFIQEANVAENEGDLRKRVKVMEHLLTEDIAIGFGKHHFYLSVDRGTSTEGWWERVLFVPFDED